jgi:D-alanyl-D-alanine carboxypeptidase
MRSLDASTTIVRRRTRTRRVIVIALTLCIAALLTVLGALLPRLLSAGAWSAPTVSDGHIPDGTVVTLADDDLPAIARLDPELREAMRRAEADAIVDGVRFEVTGGWRSEQYQEWLLDEAIEHFANEELAREFVATPERSRHVTGDAVDISPIDAQFWLIEHGARYGICQTYSNERWHFELATLPCDTCPPMKENAAE